VVTHKRAVTGLLVIGGIFREIITSGGDQSGKREVRLAGSGLYAALAASRLGTQVTLVAPVGRDDAVLACALCEEAAVRPVLLLSPGASGTFALQRLSGARPRPQYRPAGGFVDGDYSESINADIVLVFGHPEWDPLLSPSLMSAADNATLVWDRQGWLSRTTGTSSASAISAQRRIQVTNADEVFDEFATSPSEVIAGLPPAGFDASVIKDGRWGVHVVHGDRARQSVAAFEVEVHQTIGSGDVFAGALCAALAQRASLVEACETGAASAATWISSEAALPGMDFADAVARLHGQPRLPVVSPERLREVTATVVRGHQIGNVALAETACRILEDIGLRTVADMTRASEGVVVELCGEKLIVDATAPGDARDLARRLAKFVTNALAVD